MEKATLIEFRGSIKYETIGELIHRFKLLVPKLGIQIGVYKRILLVLIESLENIMKHSMEPVSDENHCFLGVYQTEIGFTILTQNALRENAIEALKAKIDFLNSLDAQDLKSVYKDTITNGVFTNTGGAGLGLIEIARISGNPIKYKFDRINENFATYTQEVFIRVK